MDNSQSDLGSMERTQEHAVAAMQTIVSAARADAVYGNPVTVGDYTIITASEVAAGGGFGFGGGSGPAPVSSAAATGEPAQAKAVGGGGGGGGGSTARPVALIVIGPAGVEVRPVVDVTKIALAVLTGAGAALLAYLRIRRL